MARRLARGGVRVVGYDATPGAADALAAEPSFTAAGSLAALVDALATPRVVWLMVPAGAATAGRDRHARDAARARRHDRRRRQRELQGFAAPRGGSRRRAASGSSTAACPAASGGSTNGYALMFGGTPEAARAVEPFARILAPGAGPRLAALRPAGLGPLRQDDPQRHRVRDDAGVWPKASRCSRASASSRSTSPRSPRSGATAASCARGSSTSRAEFLARDATLDAIAPHVADSGEGRWTVARGGRAGRARAGAGARADVALRQRRARPTTRNKMLAMMRKALRRPRGARRRRGAAAMIVVVMGVTRLRQDHGRRGARASAGLAVPRCRRFPSGRERREDGVGRAAHRRRPLAVARPHRRRARGDRSRAAGTRSSRARR